MNASFWLRFYAFLIDYIIIFIYLIFILLTGFLFPSMQNLFNGSVIIAQLTGFLLVTLPVSLYFIISDSYVGKQSIGKKKVGIRVVTNNGEATSILRMAFRTLLKFLPWELSHFLAFRLIHIGEGEVPFIYYLIGILIYALMFGYILSAIFTKRKQSIYDILTKTQVVKA
ncbi:putative RDD family membrane protein YckC [Gracilibacillus halotolerans]|uniref:Putative RDD family membrane protein YckC n=1 Tax=Gracilibacillus halotolerans TaxID=74386 RepID=A0A841RJX2_9BACI|nr:RDD family protein [Gracilibacillus halotolerans]MBB6512809.1 putative RDD family membrane protein YckC [Gracilibacillus halotolerans]